MKKIIACAALGLLAGSCEQMQPMLAQSGYTHDLGDFDVVGISFIEEMPGPGDGYDGGGYLRLQLATERELSTNYPTHWIGVASDYCPLVDDHNLIAFGTIGEDGLYWDEDNLKTVEKSADGTYRYDVYVVRAYPPPGKTRDDFGGPQSGPNVQSEYDIIEAQKDLCLQVFGGDHYNVFARSSVIRVPHEAIRSAAVEAEMTN